MPVYPIREYVHMVLGCIAGVAMTVYAGVTFGGIGHAVAALLLEVVIAYFGIVLTMSSTTETMTRKSARALFFVLLVIGGCLGTVALIVRQLLYP